MPLRPLLARMPSSHRSCSPLHSLFEAEHTDQNRAWNSNTLATWCKELIHLKRPWCWERLKAGGEGDYGVWDGWMASSTQWTWVWVNSGSWWWTGRPGVLQSMGLQRVRHNWATKLNRRLKSPTYFYCTSFSFFCSAKKKDIRWKLQLLKL